MSGVTPQAMTLRRFPPISLETAFLVLFATWPALSFLIVVAGVQGWLGGWEIPLDPYQLMLSDMAAAVSLFHVALRRRAWSLCVLAVFYVWFCAVPGQIAVASPAL